MTTIRRRDVRPGMLVEIDKQNHTYRGYIQEVLTQTNNAKRVKVRLKSGEVGHVAHLVTKEEMEMERLKYYNLFFTRKSSFPYGIRKRTDTLSTSPSTNENRSMNAMATYLQRKK